MNATPPRNLGIKFDEDFSAWLDHFERTTGIPAVNLGRALFSAAREEFNEKNELTFPLRVISANDLELLKEARARYKSTVSSTGHEEHAQDSSSQNNISYKALAKAKKLVQKPFGTKNG